MFGRSVALFRLLGFQVQADLSWLILAFLITWSLATGYFPLHYTHLTPVQYWGMGILAAVGLFGSLIFHELSHSLVARRFGIPMKGITLLIFGGVAHMEEEPPNPKSEFLMAIAGPVSSVLLAALLYAVMWGGRAIGWPEPANGILGYLAFINVLLAMFNMVPAFPLDGGRIFRSALWAWKGDLRWGTKLAARFGSAFSILLMGWGAFNLLSGHFVGGFWYLLIGFFLYGAADQAYQQMLVNRVLSGEPVTRFMSRDPISVPLDISVRSLVDDYFYRYFHDVFPVVVGTQVVGCVSKRQIAALPRSEWPYKTVADIMTGCSSENTVQAECDVIKALAQMNKTGSSRLLVLDGDRLVGMIVLKDLLKYLAFRMDLEGTGRAA
ncbi:MAG: peptidase M50 [Nitrospira sp. SG-bin1]|nr:MAG: peptidase M50 [Nitrospira sp. SG-bin1]